MGFEWSIKQKNKTLADAIPQIYKCLIDEGIENVQMDSKGISILSGDKKWPTLAEISMKGENFYCVFYSSFSEASRTMEKIEQALNSKGFEVIIDEL